MGRRCGGELFGFYQCSLKAVRTQVGGCRIGFETVDLGSQHDAFVKGGVYRKGGGLDDSKVKRLTFYVA